MFVAPNERILSNHLQVLAGSLARNPDAPCAATAVIHQNGPQPVHSVQDEIDFRQLRAEAPIGYARFIVRMAAVAHDVGLFLPYLDRKAMAILTVGGDLIQELPSTVLIQVDRQYPSGHWDEGQENELLCGFSASVFRARSGHAIILPALSLPSMAQSGLPERPRHPLGWFVFQSRLMRRDGARARLMALTRKIERRLA